jgi:hypothetical protein
MEGGVSELFFRHRKTQQACRIFLDWIKKKDCEPTPSEVSQFARDLQAGRVVKGFTYQRRVFYATILRTLMAFGFVGKATRYGKGVVYVPILQPIPRRAPIMTTWWGFAYLVAETWNRDMLSVPGHSTDMHGAGFLGEEAT